MEILLDTSFILTCAKQKIDFFSLASDLFDEKIEFLLPKEVLSELEKISIRSGERTEDKNAAKLALELIKINKIRHITLNTKIVDVGLVNYIKTHDGAVLASLDKKIKKKINARCLVIRNKKNLAII